MGMISRAMLPVVALGVGTWIGMGRPDARTTVAVGVRAASSATEVVQTKLAPLVSAFASASAPPPERPPADSPAASSSPQTSPRRRTAKTP